MLSSERLVTQACLLHTMLLLAAAQLVGIEVAMEDPELQPLSLGGRLPLRALLAPMMIGSEKMS